MKRGPLTGCLYSLFALFLPLFSFFLIILNGFQVSLFTSLLKKWFLGIITFISVYAALAHQWRPGGTLQE